MPSKARRLSSLPALIGLLAAMVALPAALVPPASVAIPPGGIPVTVTILRWSDQPASPFSVDQVRDALFTGAHSASGFIAAVTDGDSHLVEKEIVEATAAVAGDDPAIASCDLATVLAGVGSVPPDERRVVVTPPMSCPGTGHADQPGNRVELIGTLNWRLAAHELLHNESLAHAGRCTSQAANGDCVGDSYGDPFDIMGASTGANAGFPSAWGLGQLGEISPAQTADVSADGVYTLVASNNTAAGGVKLLAVPRPGSASDYLFLETRIARPYDDFQAPGSRLYNGVTVRLGSTAQPNNVATLLVPANPAASTATPPVDWPLARCEVYTDARSGATIRPLSIAGGVAAVQIALGGRTLAARPECASAASETGKTPETKKPKGPTSVRKGKVARYQLRSPVPGVTYECRIDKKKWKPCGPGTYKVKTKRLAVGKHVLLVRAVKDGAKDPTPARKKLTVRR